MSHELAAAIPPLPEPTMTPTRKPSSTLPNWISGKVTINAGLAIVALGVAVPQAISFLDARYGTREERRVEITALHDEIKSLREQVREQGRMLAGLDSSDRCRRGLKGFCR